MGACADLQRLAVALRVKRVYEEPEEVDGERMLIDRLWPRGLSKEKAEITAWRKDLAPSDELRKWFGHEADRWEEFMKRYRVELEEAGKTENLRKIGERAAERNVTLLFGAKDTEHNVRTLMAFVRELGGAA